MANKKTLVAVAILETLEETTKPGDYAPNGMLWAAVQTHVTLSDYNSILAVMRENGWITSTAETVTLTDKGRELVTEAKKTA